MMISMANVSANLVIALPEIFLLVMILLILLVDAFGQGNKERVVFTLTMFSLVIAIWLQFFIYNKCITPQGNPILTFNDMFILDNLAQIMKLAIYLLGVVILFYIRRYILDRRIMAGGFYTIFLFAILGMLVMISANNLLVLYIGLELLSLALYGLVASNYNNVRSIEAAMKFFILGAIASGLLLYGISFIYGATGGQLQLDQVFNVVYSSREQFNLTGNNFEQNYVLLVFGLAFIVAGLVFKLGLAPFHMWIPDVYEGSSLAVTTIIGTITKIAAVVFVIRFLICGLGSLNCEWSIMLSILAFVSLFIGNIVAIAQTNIKRMLGYSTVAHMGFIAFGFTTVSINGLFAVLFYLFTYVIAALAGFGVLIMLSARQYECEKIEDLKGLSTTHPIYAGVMLLVMFSLAGIPPLAGFYAKFKILEALVDAGFIKTAVYAVVMSLIGAFYYLRIVKIMYFDDKILTLNLIDSGCWVKSIVVINGLLLLLLGIMPSQILSICASMVGGIS